MNTPVRLSLSQDSTTRLQQMRVHFPHAAGPDLEPAWRGGRALALRKLAAIDAEAYARSRNQLNGAVTRLSPYLRHGCLTVRETVADIRRRFGKRGLKLISELCYRDYFRQAWLQFGQAILHEMEPPKVTLGQAPLPDYVRQRFTGLVCMDQIVAALQDEGYVHNHARMWFAAYVVHWLKVDWRQAADWFEQQLLDGDLASNHLSWQWIASSFSHKPYFFNKESLRKFAGDQWCRQCKVRCPFDRSYERLEQELFSPPSAGQPVYLSSRSVDASVPTRAPSPASRSASSHQSPVLWLHDEMLSAEHLRVGGATQAVFVFDPALYGQWPLKRLQFMADCLAELPNVEVWAGETQAVLAHYAERPLISQQTPQTALHTAVAGLAVQWLPEPALTTLEFSDYDLMRFSRYWRRVENVVMSAGARP